MPIAGRARMILLAAEGLNNDEIAARLDSRREVAGRWRKRFFIERLKGLEEQARPGCPRTCGVAMIWHVKFVKREGPWGRAGYPLARRCSQFHHPWHRAGNHDGSGEHEGRWQTSLLGRPRPKVRP